MKLQCFAPQQTSLEEVEGWYSTAYRKRTERTAITLNTAKKEKDTLRYITVIYPTAGKEAMPEITARFKSKTSEEGKMKLEVSIDGKKRILTY